MVDAIGLTLVSMRPRQWTKNLVVFAPLVFAGLMTSPVAVVRAVAAFVALCALSGALYIVNDLLDATRDRVHAEKRGRPIAAGSLHARTALGGALIGIIIAAGTAAYLGPRFSAVLGAFAVLQVTYVLWTKHQVVLDVMSIAVGFILRAVAGAVAVDVPVSSWLLACAGLLALFLGLAKRRHELLALEKSAHEHRPALASYSMPLIDSMLSSVTAATIVTYALYTFFSTTGQQAHYLMLTVPFVVYGLFRYLYLVHRENLGGAPEEVLLSDRPLIAAIAAWVVVSAVVLYAR